MTGRRRAAGALVLLAIGLLVGGSVAGLLYAAAELGTGAGRVIDAYLVRVTLFTLWQALLSTVLSVAAALPLARALARRDRFPGRALLVRFLALPLALPALVVVLAVVEVWGRRGWANEALQSVGFDVLPSIYGLPGILVAHVFFNLPLAARLMLSHLERIPSEHWRLAGQLGLGPAAVFRLIEWPVLRRRLPGVAGLVFMLCVASFTVVLTLGGGPGATTIEVAIYQALRFDFDPGRAVVLSGLQLVLTSAVLLLALRLGAPLREEAGLGRPVQRFDGTGFLPRLGDGAVILLATAYLVFPLAALVAAGLAADLARLAGEPIVRRAVATSLVLSALAASLSTVMTVALIAARRASRGRAFALATYAAASLILVVPPIVIGAGWFVLLNPFVDVFALAPLMVVVVNAAMALPFTDRVLSPAVDTVAAQTGRLAESLGVRGLAWLRLVGWPLLRRPAALAFAFAMALSLGDLGVIALYGSDAVTTLPYLLLQRMGSYRTADAAGLALLLGILTLAVLMTAELGRGRAGVRSRMGWS